MQELNKKDVVFHAVAVLGPLAASLAVSMALPTNVPPVAVPLGWLAGTSLIYGGKILNEYKADKEANSSNPTLALPPARIEDYEPVTPRRLALTEAQLEYARNLFKTRAFLNPDLRIGLGVLVTEENQRPLLPEAQNNVRQQLPELPTRPSSMPTGFASPPPTASSRASVPKQAIPDYRVERSSIRDVHSTEIDDNDFDFDSPTWLETEPGFDDDAAGSNSGYTYPDPDEFFYKERQRDQQPRDLRPEQYYTQSLMQRRHPDGVDEED